MKRFTKASALFIAALAMLCPSAGFGQDFLGLRLGMSPVDAGKIAGKTIELASYKTIRGQKIVNDTIVVPSCSFSFRRSIAFDSLQRLSVVGLTHRGSDATTEKVQSCVLNWLTGSYGLPEIDSVTNDTVDMYIWRTKDAMITMDARPYNERHSFVAIYYFKRDLTARKEDDIAQ